MKHIPKLELRTATNGQHYFRLVGANGEVVVVGEMHPTRAAAKRAALRLVWIAASAVVEVVPADGANPAGKPIARLDPTGKPIARLKPALKTAAPTAKPALKMARPKAIK